MVVVPGILLSIELNITPKSGHHVTILICAFPLEAEGHLAFEQHFGTYDVLFSLLHSTVSTFELEE